MKSLITSGILLALIAMIPLTSIAQDAPKKYVVTDKTAGKYKEGEISLHFASHDELLEELVAKRVAKSWKEELFEEKKAKLPKGGKLKFDISQKKEDAANSRNIRVVVTSPTGKELHRGAMPSKPPKKDGKMWVNSKWITMDMEMPDSFNVEVINNITKNKYEFTVERK